MLMEGGGEFFYCPTNFFCFFVVFYVFEGKILAVKLIYIR